jgi:predicted ABC-type ATPase
MPKCFIIAGPNGAGKSTSAFQIFSDLKDFEFVNADLIARGLSPLNPQSVPISAGKIMLARIQELITDRADFSFEATLSSKNFIKIIKEMKNLGYEISIIYMYVDSPELAFKRVQLRAKQGGHFIDQETVYRRYIRSLKNFFELYSVLADDFYFYDNSSDSPVFIASKHNGNNWTEVWNKIKELANGT